MHPLVYSFTFSCVSIEATTKAIVPILSLSPRRPPSRGLAVKDFSANSPALWVWCSSRISPFSLAFIQDDESPPLPPLPFVPTKSLRGRGLGTAKHFFLRHSGMCALLLRALFSPSFLFIRQPASFFFLLLSVRPPYDALSRHHNGDGPVPRLAGLDCIFLAFFFFVDAGTNFFCSPSESKMIGPRAHSFCAALFLDLHTLSGIA